MATTVEIVGKVRRHQFSTAAIDDFDLRHGRRADARAVLDNPAITLYCLDMARDRAVFVESAEDADLDRAPFLFLAQYETAVRAHILPFHELLPLAQKLPLDDRRLVFLYTTGRAGSTLASQIFSRVPGVHSLSEPDALMPILVARYYHPQDRARLRALLDAVVRVLCKRPAAVAHVIKGRSFIIQLGDWLAELYPRATNLFLYRDAVSWLDSSLRAFPNSPDVPLEELRAIERERRPHFIPIVPLIAAYDPDKHLTRAGGLSLAWLSVMERYERLQQQGVPLQAIRYDSWQRAPRATAVAMLEACGMRLANLAAIEEVLARDSQAGTALSRRAIRGHPLQSPTVDPSELFEHLRAHPFIRTADFEATHTLKPGEESEPP